MTTEEKHIATATDTTTTFGVYLPACFYRCHPGLTVFLKFLNEEALGIARADFQRLDALLSPNQHCQSTEAKTA